MKMRKLLGFISACFVIFFLSGATFALAPEEILKKADNIRAPFKTFVMDVDLISLSSVMSFRVYSRKGEDSLVLFLKPFTEKGRLLLMKEENLWIYIPGTHWPLRITPQQRLAGGIVNGELARLRWSLDYNVKQIGENEKSYGLELTSKKKGATYYRMEVLIEKNSFKPLRSKVYLQSGKLSKTIYFTGFTSFSGNLMATELKFVDHLRNEEESKLLYSNVRYQEMPDNYFNTEDLPRLSETLAEK